jgi:hypothetical protein
LGPDFKQARELGDARACGNRQHGLCVEQL